ncbi:MAG: hypothetical protein ACXWFZ_10205 [Nitrososphaeraceae archaeon]
MCLQRTNFSIKNTIIKGKIKTIIDVGSRLNKTPESERPSKVIFIITTDGLENASSEFTYQKIKEVISHQEEKYSWEFIFVAANIDVAKEAKNLGIRASRSTKYVSYPTGTGVMYNVLAEIIRNFIVKIVDMNGIITFKKLYY